MEGVFRAFMKEMVSGGKEKAGLIEVATTINSKLL